MFVSNNMDNNTIYLDFYYTISCTFNYYYKNYVITTNFMSYDYCLLSVLFLKLIVYLEMIYRMPRLFIQINENPSYKEILFW